MEFGTRHNFVISCVTQPITYIGFISFLAWFLNANMSWDPSIMFFHWFIPLYLASFFIEAILTFPEKSSRGWIRPLSAKFVQMVAVEFAGVAGFAILTFAPHTTATLLLAIKLLVVVMACRVGLELYHKFIVPSLNKIKLTPQTTTLIVVGMTVTIFFEAMWAFFVSGQHILLT